MDLRNKLLTLNDRPLVPVPVSEWNATIYVRALTLAELKDVSDFRMKQGENESLSNAAMVAKVALDGDGNRIFTDDDVAALAQKSAASLLKIITATNKVNVIGDEKVIEQLKGN